MIIKLLNKFLGEKVVRSSTFRDSLIASFGSGLAGLLGAIFYILCARILGPAQFGILMVAVTTVSLLSDIGNLATDPGMIRFIGQNIKENKYKAYQFLKLSFEIKLIIAFSFILIGWIISPYLASSVFYKPEFLNPLRLGFIGAATYVIISFSTTYFQSIQKFWYWVALHVGSNLVRLIIVLILWFYGSLNLENSLLTYVLVPFIFFLGSLAFIPKEFFKVKHEGDIRRELFHYNKWVTLYATVAALSTRLDTFIAARLITPTELGYYSAANQLVVFIPQFISALGAVLAPKLSSIKSHSEFLNYFKNIQLTFIGLACLGLIGIPVVLFLTPFIYGSQYADHVPVLFIVLYLAMLIFLVSVPIHNSILYYFGRPKVFIYSSLSQVFINIFIGWILISNYGSMGAAYTVLISMLSSLLIPGVWFLKNYKKDKDLL